MEERNETNGKYKEEGIIGLIPAVTVAKQKRKLALGGTGTTPKKTKVVTTPASPQTFDDIALLAEKLKDHSKAVQVTVETTQTKTVVGVVERIAELQHSMEDLRRMVDAQPYLEVSTNVTGTSQTNPEQVPRQHEVPWHFNPDKQDMVEIPRKALHWKSSGKAQLDVENPIIQLDIEQIPLESLRKVYMHAYDELRQREEVTYLQKKSVEQGYDAKMCESLQVMCQKAKVDKEVSHIKETIDTLSRTFLELAIQAEGTTEEVVHQVTDLVKNIQVRVVEVEAQVIRSTPQEVQDQCEVNAKGAKTSITATVGQYDRLVGDIVPIWSDLEENVESLQVQTQMEELQKQHERLKLELKTMSPIQKI